MFAELYCCFATQQEEQTGRAACIAELESLVRGSKLDSEVGKDIIETLQKSKKQAAQAIEKYTRQAGAALTNNQRGPL